MDKCPQCNSEKLIPHVRVIDRANSGEMNLTAVVYERPGNLPLPLLRGGQKSELRATICGECGHTILKAENPDKLLLCLSKSKAIRLI